MTRQAVAALAAFAIAVSAWAMTSHYSSGSAGLSITATNLNTSFTDNHSGGTAAAFQANSVLVRSRTSSANMCHFDLGDGVATTADMVLAPGESVVVEWNPGSGGSGGGWNAIGAICAGGETATWDIDAWR